MTHNNSNSRKGFSLIELSVSLVVVGMVISLGLALLPQQTRHAERTKLDTSSKLLEQTERSLIAFAQTSFRLPCPDSTAIPDGVEDCGGVAVGGVPWATMGLPAQLRDEAGVPLRYAVYRNIGVADLAVSPIGNGFAPVLAGNPATILGSYNPTPSTTANQNDLDLCLAIRTGRAQVASTALAHTVDQNAVTRNVAFIVASGGIEDADGDGLLSSFDGNNDILALPLQFNDPAQGRTATYDDLVRATPFSVLESKLSCGAITTVVNASAVLSIAAAHQVVLAEDATVQAAIGVATNAIGIGTAASALGIATAETAVAAADLLTGTAECEALLPNGCAAAALAALAVTAASVAVVSATTAVTLSVVNTVTAAAIATSAGVNLVDANTFATRTLNAAITADLGGQI